MNLEKINNNCVIINSGDWELLFSYNKLVAAIDLGVRTVFRTQDHDSVTTSKHINAFIKRVPKFTIQPVTQDDLEKFDLNNPVTRAYIS